MIIYIYISYSVLLIETLWSIVFLASYDLIIVQNLRVRSLKYVKKTFDFNWSKISSWSTIEFKISSWSFSRVYLTHLSVLISVGFLIVKTDKILDRMINSWFVFIRLLLQTSPSRFSFYEKIYLSSTSLIDIRSVIKYGRLVDERILCMKFRFHKRSDRTQWVLNFDDVVVKFFCKRFISFLRNVISLFFHIFFEDGPNWITFPWSNEWDDSDIVRYVFRAIYFPLMFSKCQYSTRLVLESHWDTRFHSPFVQDPLVIKKSYLRHLHSESYIWSVKDILKISYSLSYFSSTFRSQDFSLFKNFISRIFEEFRVTIIDIRLSTFVSQLTKFWWHI